LGRSLKNAALSFALRENDIQQFLFVNNAGAAEGLLGVLKGPTFSGKPSAHIPEDADEFTMISLNIPVLYGIVKDIANSFQALQMGGAAGAGGAGAPDAEQMIE